MTVIFSNNADTLKLLIFLITLASCAQLEFKMKHDMYYSISECVCACANITMCEHTFPHTHHSLTLLRLKIPLYSHNESVYVLKLRHFISHRLLYTFLATRFRILKAFWLANKLNTLLLSCQLYKLCQHLQCC